MKVIPDYRVCYKGEFYEAHDEFDIDPKDADEMSEHGEIVDDNNADEREEQHTKYDTHEDKPKRGRQPKEER